MYSALGDAALPAPGFPIRCSTGHWLFSPSPWLIAAVHVLLRLLVPRHPPCALTILTVSCPRTRVSESSASYPCAPNRGDAKKHSCVLWLRLAAHPRMSAWPSAVFKVHGGDRTGASRRRL